MDMLSDESSSSSPPPSLHLTLGFDCYHRSETTPPRKSQRGDDFTGQDELKLTESDTLTQLTLACGKSGAVFSSFDLTTISHSMADDPTPQPTNIPSSVERHAVSIRIDVNNPLRFTIKLSPVTPSSDREEEHRCKCDVCGMPFENFQQLGGHKTCHRAKSGVSAQAQTRKKRRRSPELLQLFR